MRALTCPELMKSEMTGSAALSSEWERRPPVTGSISEIATPPESPASTLESFVSLSDSAEKSTKQASPSSVPNAVEPKTEAPSAGVRKSASLRSASEELETGTVA